MKAKEKPKYNLFQNLTYLLSSCWKVTRGLLLTMLAIALFQLMNNLVGLYIAPMILQKVEQTAPLVEMLITILVFTLALALSTIGLRYLKETKCIFVSRFYTHFFLESVMKSATTSYPNTLDTEFLQKQELSERAMGGDSDSTAPIAMMTESGNLLMALIGFVLYLLVLTGLNPILLTVVVATTAISFFVSRHINKWEFDTRDEARKYQYEMRFVTNTAMGNEIPKDIRIFHMQPWLLEIHDKALNCYQGYCNRRERHFMLAKVADVILTVARNAIAYVYLIYMVIEQGLPASQFLLYFSAVTGFTNWVTTILDSVITLHRESQKLCQVREHLEWPEPFQFEEGAAVPRREDGQYELRLENVTFRYAKADKDTITNMNLTIRPGEKLAIVGLNGAGKTTLVKLLCGLLDPTQGRVLLNGEDIRQYNRRDYYAMFTAVFQAFSLLQSSVAANIAQSETDIDRDKVLACVQRAGFAEMIDKLPNGLDTNLGKMLYDDGIELSGGQEQRMMLARALYKNAPILLLDEPTAALDPIAENDMYLRYNEITDGRTAIYISHRLASTRFCDRVLFLKAGVIAEEGTHDELLALGGGYAELFEVQSRYYREGGNDHEAESDR